MHCHCLCRINHPGEHDICAGVPDTAIYFRSPIREGERVSVPMCSACATATLVRVQERRRDHQDGER